MSPSEFTRKDAVCELFDETRISPRITAGPGNEHYIGIEEAEFDDAILYLSAYKFVLIGLFCVEGFSGPGYTLFYTFEKKERILVLMKYTTGRATSIAGTFPAAVWPERECHDGFGIEFAGTFDNRRLFLHESYPDDFHPLQKAVSNIPIDTKTVVGPGENYLFRKVSGEGIYQVPVGPVHAGIIEPGHFRFSVIGETVFNLEVRLFYTHRGIEKLAEGKLPGECVPIAEAISGDESVANATAFCMAVERLSGIAVPDRAWHLRTILAELERCCSHLGDQAGMLTDVAFPLGASQFAVLREELFRKNGQLTGSRFMRGMLSIGGISKDIDNASLTDLTGFLKEFRRQYKVGLKIVLSTSSIIDRFESTGIIRESLLRPLNITGPAARGSGGRVDVRINHPYGKYDRFVPALKPLKDGDVLSRFTIKAAEIMNSLDLIDQVIDAIPHGPVRNDLPVRDGYSLALVESARGQNLCWVWIKGGVVNRYKVRTASFCNWLALEHAVPGNIIADFPVINKSLNLSYAGTDL